MLEAHPGGAAIESAALLACIDACFDCAQSCTACADADLGEDDIGMLIRCIRLCLDCSDLCDATARIVTRQTAADLDVLRVTVEACAVACRVCGDECERHASHHEHCRLCAESCRRCEDVCNAVVAAIG